MFFWTVRQILLCVVLTALTIYVLVSLAEGEPPGVDLLLRYLGSQPDYIIAAIKPDMASVEQANIDPFSGAGTTLVDTVVGTPPYLVFVNYERRAASGDLAPRSTSHLNVDSNDRLMAEHMLITYLPYPMPRTDRREERRLAPESGQTTP